MTAIQALSKLYDAMMDVCIPLELERAATQQILTAKAAEADQVVDDEAPQPLQSTSSSSTTTTDAKPKRRINLVTLNDTSSSTTATSSTTSGMPALVSVVPVGAGEEDIGLDEEEDMRDEEEDKKHVAALEQNENLIDNEDVVYDIVPYNFLEDAKAPEDDPMAMIACSVIKDAIQHNDVLHKAFARGADDKPPTTRYSLALHAAIAQSTLPHEVETVSCLEAPCFYVTNQLPGVAGAFWMVANSSENQVGRANIANTCQYLLPSWVNQILYLTACTNGLAIWAATLTEKQRRAALWAAIGEALTWLRAHIPPSHDEGTHNVIYANVPTYVIVPQSMTPSSESVKKLAIPWDKVLEYLARCDARAIELMWVPSDLNESHAVIIDDLLAKLPKMQETSQVPEDMLSSLGEVAVALVHHQHGVRAQIADAAPHTVTIIQHAILADQMLLHYVSALHNHIKTTPKVPWSPVTHFYNVKRFQELEAQYYNQLAHVSTPVVDKIYDELQKALVDVKDKPSETNQDPYIHQLMQAAGERIMQELK
jgi:hypothetical protein